MDQQKMFNDAYLGLKRQDFKKSTQVGFGLCKDASCAYRGSLGRKCAIGFCIPDKDYSHSLEHSPGNASAILKILAKVYGYISPADKEFIYELQRAHDSSYSTGSMTMERNLLAFAKRHSLTIPETS